MEVNNMSRFVKALWVAFFQLFPKPKVPPVSVLLLEDTTLSLLGNKYRLWYARRQENVIAFYKTELYHHDLYFQLWEDACELTRQRNKAKGEGDLLYKRSPDHEALRGKGPYS